MTRLRTPLEWKEQEALFVWAALHTPQEPRLALLYAVPNGEKRDKRTAAKLQKMGVKPGVPDLCLPVGRRSLMSPVGWWHSLYIELKALGAPEPPAHQQAMIEALRRANNNVAILWGWVAAAQFLCWYLTRDDLAKGLE